MKPGVTRLLLADDDESFRRVQEYQLQQAGYEVTSCPDGQSALDAFRRELHDMVVTDIRMPGLDGLELLARLRAIIRRSTGQSSSLLEIGPLSLDTRQMRISVRGKPVNLSPQEYRLVSYLMHHAGRVVPQMELTEHLYAQDFERDSNVIEVLVGRVRRKLGIDLIETRRGFGYIVEAPGPAPGHEA